MGWSHEPAGPGRRQSGTRGDQADSATHLSQSKAQMPGPGVPGGPKGCQEQAEPLAAQAAGPVLPAAQLPGPLEQVRLGEGHWRTGMQKPTGRTVGATGPHHWQHGRASHSAAVVELQAALAAGAGGAGAAATAAAAASSFTATAAAARAWMRLRARTATGVSSAGALHLSQS